MASIGFGESYTKHHGDKRKVAVVYVNGGKTVLTLGDTTRCAKDAGAAARTVANLAKQAGEEKFKPSNEGAELMAFCRKLLGLRDEG